MRSSCHLKRSLRRGVGKLPQVNSLARMRREGPDVMPGAVVGLVQREGAVWSNQSIRHVTSGVKRSVRAE